MEPIISLGKNHTPVIQKMAIRGEFLAEWEADVSARLLFWDESSLLYSLSNYHCHQHTGSRVLPSNCVSYQTFSRITGGRLRKVNFTTKCLSSIKRKWHWKSDMIPDTLSDGVAWSPGFSGLIPWALWKTLFPTRSYTFYLQLLEMQSVIL